MYLKRNSIEKFRSKLFYFCLIFFSTFSILPNAAQSISQGLILFLILLQLKFKEFLKNHIIIIGFLLIIFSYSYILTTNIVEFKNRFIIFIPIYIWILLCQNIKLNISQKKLYFIKIGFIMSLLIYIILFLQFYLFGLDQYYVNNLDVYPMLYSKIEYNSLSLIRKLFYLNQNPNCYLNAEYTYAKLAINNEFFRHHLYISLIFTLGSLFCIQNIYSSFSSILGKFILGLFIIIFILFILYLEGQSKWLGIFVTFFILITKIFLTKFKKINLIIFIGFIFFILVYLNSIFQFTNLSLPYNVSIVDSNRISIINTLIKNISFNQLIFGIGLGDIQDLLNSNLPQNILSKDINDQYIYLNTHNQYLDLLLAFGLIGLVLILSIVFFYLLKFWEVTKNYQYLIYTIFIIFMLFFENIFNRSWGISFIFFYLLILKTEFENIKLDVKK